MCILLAFAGGVLANKERRGSGPACGQHQPPLPLPGGLGKLPPGRQRCGQPYSDAGPSPQTGRSPPAHAAAGSLPTPRHPGPESPPGLLCQLRPAAPGPEAPVWKRLPPATSLQHCWGEGANGLGLVPSHRQITLIIHDGGLNVAIT
jgi:hypothetical protein